MIENPETLQDYFDNAVEWAFVHHHGPAYRLEQQPPWHQPIAFCQYCTEGGNACLIGASWPGKFSPETMEEADEVLRAAGVPTPYGINQLQNLHDRLAASGKTHPLLYFPALRSSAIRFAHIWRLALPEVLRARD